jgi:hypothetical protein
MPVSDEPILHDGGADLYFVDSGVMAMLCLCSCLFYISLYIYIYIYVYVLYTELLLGHFSVFPIKTCNYNQATSSHNNIHCSRSFELKLGETGSVLCC